MPNLADALLARLQPAFDAVEPGADPVVHASTRADYQANGVMGLAKRLGRPPREVADEVLAALDLGGLATVEVAGPGFLNLTLDEGFLARALEGLKGDDRLGVADGVGDPPRRARLLATRTSRRRCTSGTCAAP